MLFELKTFGHIINLILSYVLALSMVFTKVVACVKLDPSTHVIYSSSFAFKTRCDISVAPPLSLDHLLWPWQ